MHQESIHSRGEKVNVPAFEESSDIIKIIEKKYNLESSEQERQSFDNWLSKQPESSFEKPIQIETISDLMKYLPDSGNYTEQKVNIFFHNDHFSESDLDEILRTHAGKGANFEISVVQHNDKTISIAIGNKARNISTPTEGDFFGHYHPKLNYEKSEQLPEAFVKGLLPSPGDIKGWINTPLQINKGTRIYSQNGYCEISLGTGPVVSEQIVNEYRQKYFKLFLGENILDWQNNKDIKEFFKSNFNLNIEFYYTELQ
ncbi:hypothetical protein IPN41_03175 [Candidatus Falkowbacteria bacterium]|nr:MAG: hypothetical protein IPN41_03175 [Candidatus Falkowbacteria bacterium]